MERKILNKSTEARQDVVLMATVAVRAGETPDRDLPWMDASRGGVLYKRAISPTMVRAARGVIRAYNDDIKAGKFTGVAREVVDAWKPTLGRKDQPTIIVPEIEPKPIPKDPEPAKRK